MVAFSSKSLWVQAASDSLQARSSMNVTVVKVSVSRYVMRNNDKALAYFLL